MSPSDAQTEAASNEIQDAINNNSQPSPHISIDPDTNKVGVVGDPNIVKPTSGDYTVEFELDEETASPEDIKMAKYNKELNKYIMTVNFKGKRVKPLYRSRVVFLILGILTSLDVMDQEGYTTSGFPSNFSSKLLSHIVEIGEIMQLVLGIDKDKIEYVSDISALSFFADLLNNEPNICKECIGFLGQQMATEKRKTENQNTQQN